MCDFPFIALRCRLRRVSKQYYKTSIGAAVTLMTSRVQMLRLSPSTHHFLTIKKTAFSNIAQLFQLNPHSNRVISKEHYCESHIKLSNLFLHKNFVHHKMYVMDFLHATKLYSIRIILHMLRASRYLSTLSNMQVL